MSNAREHHQTGYSTVDPVLGMLLAGLCRILDDNLVGIYLYGSLVTGDFDERASDIDLVVVLNQGLDASSFNALDALHQQVVARYPAWQDRLELAYISLDALRRFRERRSQIAIISPGEPFHQIEAGRDWLISWYMLRETGLALCGPAVASLFDPIAKSEYIEAVQRHIEGYRQPTSFAADISNWSYIVLTTARGVYTVLQGQPPSKAQAAAWAKASFPQWARLIELALSWRAGSGDADSVDKFALEEMQDQQDMQRRTQAFVEDMLARLS